MAADANTVVARVGLDDRGFQEGVSKIQRGLKLVQSEFAAASSKLGDFGKSTDGLRLKADTLNKQMELQKDKVAALNKSFQESVEKKGADAKATENLKIKLNYATAELNKMQQELKKTTTELNTKSSAWYKLSQTIDKAGEKMKAVGEKMSSIGSKLSTAVTLPLVGAGVAATKLASDYNESLNKVDVAFGKSSNEVLKWSETSLRSFGIAKGTALDMTALFGDMGTSMGISQESASKMSMSLVGLAGDLSSFKNIGIKQAETALNGIFTGETESLKRLGVVMTEANLQQFAYSQGIQKKIKDMTEAEKVQLRYNYVLEKTSNAHGDFERTGGGAANQMRIFQESLKELGTTLGQQILPIITPILTKINEWIQAFSKMDEGTKKTILVIAGIVAAIGPVILVIGKVVTAIGTITTAIGAVSGGMAAAGGSATGLGAVFTAITGPIGIAVAAVVGLIAIFVALYKNNEDFRNSVKEIWNQIKSIISGVIDSLKELFKAFVEIANEIWSKYGDEIVDIIKKAFELVASVVSTVLKTIQNVIKIITSAIKGDWKGVWEGIKKYTQDLWDGIKNIIRIALELLINIVKIPIQTISNTIKSAWEGIKTFTTSIWNGIGKTIQTVINGIIKGINFMIKALNNLKFDVPDWVPVIGGATFGFNIPLIKEVSWYSKGGIFNRPSVIGVGETGTEAVLPIDRLDEFIARAIEKVKGKGSGEGLTLNIENFINNSDKDIEQLAYELEFYRQRISLGKGRG